MANSVMDLKKEIIRLRVALADTEALELGTAERLEKVTAQLESEKLSHAAWEKQSLLEYSELMAENQRLRDALTLILEFAEQHPLFMVSTEDAESEGGDAAFVTIDIAVTARHALDCENRRFAEAHVEIKQLRDALTEARANLYDMCDAAIVYRIDEALKGKS